MKKTTSLPDAGTYEGEILGPVADSRSASRRKVLLPGKIVYDNGNYTINCIIRNMSATGAAVDIPSGSLLPSRVYLIDIRNGMAHEAEVAFLFDTKLGLKFVDSHRFVDGVAPYLDYLKRLWSYCAAAPRERLARTFKRPGVPKH